MASVTLRRRIGGVGAAILMSLTSVLAVGEVAAAPSPSDLLVHYDFSGVTSTANGAVVPDSSGNGRNATIVGTGVTVSGNALTLPGGSNASTGGVVQLPTGLFDGRNTLTISLWLQNTTGAGNYSAMFFGSAASTPSQYWLLNPRNGANQVKSVVTAAPVPASPWTTEFGFAPTNAAQGLPGPASTNDWALYTTVIQPGSISLYLNEQQVGTVATSRTVSEFGSNLVGWLGRSSYADIKYKGGIRDVRVYTTALGTADVAGLYYGGLGNPAAVQAALDSDAAAVDLGPSTIAAGITLPTTGAKGSTITWQSSDPAHLAADGSVVRPTTTDAQVTLTATCTLAGVTKTRTFAFTVLAATPENDVRTAADGFDLGITGLTSAITLKTTAANGVSISWASSNPALVSTTGAVTRPTTATPVTLTATFSKDGVTRTRAFETTVLAAETGRIGTYIRTGNTDRTDVLHLAATTGTSYTALNNGRGVLYPQVGTAKYGTPTLFRKPDGSFGLVATVDSNSGSLYYYDSTDLTTFSGERLVTFSTTHRAAALDVTYDNGLLAYRVRFTSLVDGQRYEVLTADFRTFGPATATSVPAVTEAGTFPTGALETRSIGVTAAEYQRVTTKLGRVVNTAVQPFTPVTVAAGDPVSLPTTATLEYNSGSTSKTSVTWNAGELAAASAGTPGTYTVTGTVAPQTYLNPLVEQRADPDVTLGDDGYYYFTGSYPTLNNSDPEGYDRIVLRRATTINGLKTAPEVTLWDEANSAALNRYIWAPELEKIGNSWYILFTAARSGGVWDIRPALLKLTGTDLMNPAHWTEVGQIKAKAGDTAAFTSFSLDMTHFEQNGRHYVIWAEKPGASNLRMAEIDPADPSQLISTSILLATPTMSWERNDGQNINEGPAVIKKNGKIHVAFSAATVDDKYAVGLLTADENADLLNPASWTKLGYPILTTDDLIDQRGPGHNSFTVDALGNPVIVYHARTPSEIIDGGLNDPGRHARAKTVLFDVDGYPVFNATPDEEVAPALKTVSVQVTVTSTAVPAEITAATACLGGKAVLTVRARSTASAAQTITATTPLGTKTWTNVAPKGLVAHNFAATGASIPAGQVTVTSSAGGTTTVTYAARTCG